MLCCGRGDEEHHLWCVVSASAGSAFCSEFEWLTSCEKKGDIGALKETKAELEQRLAETKKQLGTKKTEVDAVLSEVANLRKTATVEVPAKLAEKSKALEDEQRALEVARRDYEAKRVGRELRKNEMSKGVTFYKERLGLAFEKLPDCSLSFRLTLIDPENPQRPFSFAMFVDQSNVYHVLRCEPRVEFDPLLAQLNRDNKLSVFVQHMRRLFKKLV